MKRTISTFSYAGRLLLLLICLSYLPDSFGKNCTALGFSANKASMFLADVTPPTIAYTALSNTSSQSTVILNAVLKDETGVNNAVVHYKKGVSGTYTTATGSLISGTTTDGTWAFAISHGSLSPALGDTIYYFLVAQDVLSQQASLPTGAVGTDPYNITTYPANPNRFVVIGQISGAFMIGATQTAPNYTTITQALNDIAAKELTGDVTLLLQQNYVSSSEAAFPVTFKPFASSNPAFTVTLKPDAGVNAIISGSSTTAILKFADNAHHYIVDGSNNGTDSRNLFVANASTSTSSVVLFEGLAANQGVKNSTFKNAIIKGGSNTNTIGVLFGAATISLTSAGKGHDQVLLTNNNIYNCNTAVAVSGATLAEQVKKIMIVKNLIGTDSAAFPNRQYGIHVSYADAITVADNKVFNMKTTVSVNKAGISLNTNVTNSTIRANIITGVYSPSTSGYGAYGINIESTGNSNDSLINNNISDLLTANYSSTSTIYNAFGIRVNSATTNLKMYFNSVYLSGPITAGTSASTSAALFLGSTSMTGLDIRNNIFSNEITGVVTTSKHYAFRWAGTITGATFNYNIFSAATAQGILMSNNGTDVTTIAALRTATGANANSLGADPQFNSATNLVPKLGSPALAAGTSITGITLDLLGALRSATPSLGAYENGADVSGPTISYTRLANSTSVGSLTTNSFATITDPSGVDLNPGTRPRLYYKKHSDANAFGANNSSANGWKWVESYNTTSPFDFVIDYSLLNGGGVTSGDSIKYFVVAQDVNGYVGATPGIGFVATSVGAVTSAPQTPDAYVIVGGPMSGSYTVGTSGNYVNLTSAAVDIALRGLQGDVTLEVLSNITEPGAAVFSQWTETGAGGYKLNIVPSATNPAGDTIFATIASRGVVELSGADRVTINGKINGAGNFLTFVNKATSSTQYGIRVISLGTGLGATNNVITNVNVRLNYQTSDQAQAIRVEGNNNHNFQLLNSNITRASLGVYINATTAGAGNHTGVIISGNTIGGPATVDYVNTGGVVVYCTPEIQITGNHIFNIIGSSYLGACGIQLNQQTTKANVSANRIHDITNSYYYYDSYYGYEEAGPATGVNVNSATTTDSMLIANNVIYRLANASYSASETIENPFGINIGGGNGHQVLHNSVYMYGAPVTAAVAGTLSAALMVRNASLNLKVVNNIFANGFVGKAGSKSYAIYAAAASTFSNIDNNNYDTTGAGSFARIGFKGSDALNMGAWRTLTTKDQSSVAVTSMFTSNTNLQINSGSTPTPLESGALVLTNVATDHNNDVRPKTIPTSYGGNVAPDMGAYEFDGAPIDLVPPVINYTPVTKLSSSTSGESLLATITDASGVNINFGTVPRIYYKKKRDANVIAGNTSADNGWKYTEATNGASPFSFYINYSILNGGSVTHADTILYFVTAQDNAPIPNTAANPSAGFTASSVASITGLPTNPNFYIVSSAGPLNGNYSVGTTGGTSYTTITAALTDLAIRGVSGPVVFELNDAAYTSAEAFPLTIQEIVGASATNTVTIKPASGVNVMIAGSNAQAILKIADKVQYFTLDGSNNGTGSRNLLLHNTSTATSSVIWFEGLTGSVGVKNSVVKNTKVKGGSQTNTIGVLVAGSTVALTSTGTGHDRISLIGNNIYNCNAAIVSNGTSSSVKVNNLTIANNDIGTDTSNLYNRQYGVYIKNTNRAVISKNKIFNLKTSASVNNAAVELLEGTTNAMVNSNTITGIYSTSTSGYGAYGISINSSIDIFNDSICNNMISDIITSNYSVTGTTYNAFGIRIIGGSDLKIYHNTVNFYGQPTGGTVASASAALLILAGTYPNTDIRNNIFTNSMTGAFANSKHYAFWTTISAPLTSTIFNYNNFFVSGQHGILMNGNGTAITTLTDLKAATGANVNSRNDSVAYVAPSDLHLGTFSNGNVAFAGTPIATIGVDIDNNSRSTTYPYMGAHEASIPVPVKLTVFKAQLDNENVLLKWSTASEMNNEGFVIERSEDNAFFSEIGFVKGAGNSKVIRNYNYIDANAFAGKGNTLYYRLVQTDKNGTKTISAVESVTKETSLSQVLEVYPNPFTTNVNVRILNGTSGINTVEVSDMQGRVVITRSVDSSLSLILDLAHLDAGVYFLKLNGAENKVVKLIKTH